MGKGMKPKQGYNQKKYEENYEGINWSSTRKKQKNEIHSSKKSQGLQDKE